LPARQKSSATKALDREGTVTNGIAASTNSPGKGQILTIACKPKVCRERTATNGIAASTNSLGKGVNIERTFHHIDCRGGSCFFLLFLFTLIMGKEFYYNFMPNENPYTPFISY
jgi:hypothetical protein